MKKSLLFTLFLAVTTVAQAYDRDLIDAPRDAVISNTPTTSTITYSCEKTTEDTLACKFDQVFSLSEHRPENDKKALEYGKKEFLNLSDEDKNILKESCSDMKLYEQFFGKKISKQELLSKISESAVLTEAELETMSESSQQKFLQNNKDMADYCANPNLENYLIVMGLAPKENSITCLSYTNSFKQTFKYKSHGQAAGGAWVSEADKAGECGSIRASRFERSAQNSWNFTVKNAITDKKGNRNQSECAASDNNEYVYGLGNKSKGGVCHYLDTGNDLMAVTADDLILISSDGSSSIIAIPQQ